MTRTIGAGLSAELTQAAGERCQLVYLEFADGSNNPTPVYLTNAAQDITWNGNTYQAVGGLEIDAMGESADGAANGLRIKLSGVDQAILALIHGSRWRGRPARIYYAGFSQATGLVLSDPIEMYSGPMTGGFQIGESRGDFGGGKVDITSRLTSWIDELVKHRGVYTNEMSHRSVIPGATTDTFFHSVPSLMARRSFWGVKEPHTITSNPSTPTPPTGPLTPPPGNYPGAPTQNTPWPNVPAPPPPPGIPASPSGPTHSPWPNV